MNTFDLFYYYRKECFCWRACSECYIQNCKYSHLPESKGTLSHLLVFASELGILFPLKGECYFWRVWGECDNEGCMYVHKLTSRGADQECYDWRRGRCPKPPGVCKYKHVDKHKGVDAGILDNECRAWRFVGCRFGLDCNRLHIPQNKGADMVMATSVFETSEDDGDLPSLTNTTGDGETQAFVGVHSTRQTTQLPQADRIDHQDSSEEDIVTNSIISHQEMSSSVNTK